MTFADHVYDLTEWVIRYSYWILIISVAVTIYLAYMAGYWDGYHAGAIHYTVSVIDLYNKSNVMNLHLIGSMP